MRAKTDTTLPVRRVLGACAAILLACASALGTSIGPFAGTAEAAETSCSSDQVTVVVAGQGQGCASAGVTGWNALEQAGFSITPVSKFPTMICQINGAPANADCSDAPPASAYWAYYHAPLGGSWTYSNRGAGNRIATAGTVEGWAFGAGATPGEVPTARPSSNPGGGASDGGNAESGEPDFSALNPAEDDAGETRPGGEGRPVRGANGGDSANPGERDRSGSRGDRSAADGHDDDNDGQRPGRDESRDPEDPRDARSTSTADKDTAEDGEDHDGKDEEGKRSTESASPESSSAAQADTSGQAASAQDDGGNSWVPVIGIIGVIAALVATGLVVARRRAGADHQG